MTDTYCPYCGSVINQGDTFCNSCGASTEVKPSGIGSQTPTAPPPQQQFPPPPQHQYGASSQTIYQQPVKPKSSQDQALGITSIVTTFLGYCMCLFFYFLSLPLFIVGIVTGAIGMKKNPDQKALPLVGLILSIIGLVLTIILIILAVLVLSLGGYGLF